MNLCKEVTVTLFDIGFGLGSGLFHYNINNNFLSRQHSKHIMVWQEKFAIIIRWDILND